MDTYAFVGPTREDGVKKNDSQFVPAVVGNKQWNEFLQWELAGNTATPYDDMGAAYKERIAQTKEDMAACDALYVQDAQHADKGISTLTAAQKALINAFLSALDGHLKAVVAVGPGGTLPAYPHYNGASLDYFELVYGA